MNKLTYLRLEYGVRYKAECILGGECVIEKTKSGVRYGRVFVYYTGRKRRTRHFSLFTVKGKL